MQPNKEINYQFLELRKKFAVPSNIKREQNLTKYHTFIDMSKYFDVGIYVVLIDKYELLHEISLILF